MEEKTITFQTTLSKEDIAGVIESLAEGLKEGILNLQKSNSFVEMKVPENITLVINASESSKKSCFVMELLW